MKLILHLIEYTVSYSEFYEIQIEMSDCFGSAIFR